MDTSGTVGRGGNHLCYRQPAVDQREQLNSPGASGRVPEFPASTDVVPVDGGISQLGISWRENVSGRLAGGSKLLAVPPKCAVRLVLVGNAFAAGPPVASSDANDHIDHNADPD